ncbi:N-acetyl-gamma-glutamyl-phosphate reductase [Echinicola jeungdonensis]|uniref:N-acetyl-gamma-glutamyl-phosphate reductase n=1 Tax=Echinicola jeungdonensis TaxID=709343 RepID=A0ABV5J307_9BACT|nr:N-acetyl-gamma-glutamyl-phosphate reductase [Echinicola jeungdonensis]MDN3670572.1 N-acetyl-gamma-glutamyl-phosphate reductase [Echinicola jeungdonensis]
MEGKKKYNIAIVGASGYTGSELARILVQHQKVEIKMITSETHTGKPFSELHPQFLGILDLPLESAEEVSKNQLDVVFLALPHGVSMEYIKKWKDKKAMMIDLSGDYRLSGPDVYKNWYKQDHVFPEAFDRAIYGLPELHENRIRGAQLVANPGCYPTASILSLAPLFKDQLIKEGSVVIDAKSGTSGAGVKASNTTHFSNVNDNFKAYGLRIHRHTIEIEEQLGNLQKEKAKIQFTPHLLPVDRGILATSYAQVNEEMSQKKLDEIYGEFYKGKPFVRLRSSIPALKDVRGSNYCDIMPIWDERTQRVIVLSVIDNLVKGAAGQAVHNMNLMLGIPQETGLLQSPMQP